MLRRIRVILEMIQVIVVDFQRALAVLDASERIENTGFRTL